MKIITIFVLMEIISSKKLGTETELQLPNISALYGTLDRSSSKSFYIQISGWITVDTESLEYQSELLRKFERNLRHYIRGVAISIHKDYLYSFIDIQLTDTLLDCKINKGYFCIEITFHLNNPIIKFKENIELLSNINTFINLVQDKILESPFKISRRSKS